MASLPSVKYQALGKPSFFAVCLSSGTRQKFFLCHVSNSRHSAKLPPLPCVNVQALGKNSSFAVCQILDTRQTFVLCRVSNTRHSANTSQNAQNFGFFAECHSADTRQRIYFSPKMHIILSRVHFVVCFNPGTWQKASLPSVTLGKVTIYFLFLWFGHV